MVKLTVANMDLNADRSSTMISEQTLQKLTDSMNQYAASAVSAMNVPEFSGSLNEDVRGFLRKFKLSTISLTDEMRCLALEKALQGTAYIWAKENIKSLLKAGNWREAKHALKIRFREPNVEFKYHEQLSKLKFDPKVSSLQSYIENYHNCYSRAFNSTQDSSVITALKLNLPNVVQRSFNVLDDSWTEYTSMKELLNLARRAEEKILPFEQQENTSEKLDVDTLKKLLKDFRDSLVPQKLAEESKIVQEPDKALALIQQHESNTFDPRNYRANYNSPHEFEYRRRAEQYQPRYPARTRGNYRSAYNYDARQNDQAGMKQKEVPNSMNNIEPASKKPKLSSAYELYISKFGVPPGPCHECGGNHFNRHCPCKYLN